MHKMFEGAPRPLTEAEADEVLANTGKEIDAGGFWQKLCADCGNSVGGRLARYGKPTPEDLARCACPFCGAVGKVELKLHPAKVK